MSANDGETWADLSTVSLGVCNTAGARIWNQSTSSNWLDIITDVTIISKENREYESSNFHMSTERTTGKWKCRWLSLDGNWRQYSI